MTILVYKSECLGRWPDGNDHSGTILMMFHRLPEKKHTKKKNKLKFRKFKTAEFDSFWWARHQLYWNSCCLKVRCCFKMLQKGAAVLITGDRIYGPLKWTNISVMPEKILFAPLNSFGSACTVYWMIFTPFQNYFSWVEKRNYHWTQIKRISKKAFGVRKYNLLINWS